MRMEFIVGGVVLLGLLLPTVGAHGALLETPLGGSPPPPSFSLSTENPLEALRPWVIGGPFPFARDDAGGEYAIVFHCPSVVENDTLQNLGNTALCPLYLLDVEDVMSQPILYIDPKDPSLIGFNALHGGRGVHTTSDPPTPRSRQNLLHQPHTNWISRDGGATWYDNPYYAPDSLSRNRTLDVYGEDNAAVLDGEGNLYTGDVYSVREGAIPSDRLPFGTGGATSTGEPTYIVKLWKGQRINRDPNYFANYKEVRSGPHDPSSNKDLGKYVVDSIYGVYVPETRSVVFLWRESANTTTQLPQGGAPSDKSSYVRIFHASSSGGWKEVSPTQRVGPCRMITNPIALGPMVYFGCLPDRGYMYSINQTDGIQIHALDTRSWTTRYVGPTPLGPTSTLHALLVKLENPNLDTALLATWLNDGKPAFYIVLGEDAYLWNEPIDLSDKVKFSSTGTNTEAGSLVSFRVTASVYSPFSDTIHAILSARYDLGGEEYSPQARPYAKILVALSGRDGKWMTSVPLPVGERSGGFSPVYTGTGSGIYEDLHDSLVVWKNPAHGGYREFIAYGDMGFVRFAEIREENVFLPIPPPIANIPAIPVAEAGTNLAQVGAVAGALSLAMLLRLLAARRKITAEAPQE